MVSLRLKCFRHGSCGAIKTQVVSSRGNLIFPNPYRGYSGKRKIEKVRKNFGKKINTYYIIVLYKPPLMECPELYIFFYYLTFEFFDFSNVFYSILSDCGRFKKIKCIYQLANKIGHSNPQLSDLIQHRNCIYSFV